MDKIIQRTNEKRRFQAVLHGTDIIAPQAAASDVAPVNLTEGQMAAADSALKAALSRKQRELGGNRG